METTRIETPEGLRPDTTIRSVDGEAVGTAVLAHGITPDETEAGMSDALTERRPLVGERDVVAAFDCRTRPVWSCALDDVCPFYTVPSSERSRAPSETPTPASTSSTASSASRHGSPVTTRARLRRRTLRRDAPGTGPEVYVFLLEYVSPSAYTAHYHQIRVRMDVTGSEHIVAICGSQRADSHTRTALERALATAEEHGATTDLVALDDLDLPVFDPDEPDAGDTPELTRRVAAADGVVLGTPMYHGSYSSPLKTALDYCSFAEFEDTTVGLLVVAGGGFPTPALEHLRSVARALDAWVLPRQVAIPNAHATFDDDGEFTDEDLRERVDALATDIVDYASVPSHPEETPAPSVG